MSMKFIKAPRLRLDGERIVRAVENALTGAAYDAKADFGVTTQTWKTRPEFEIEKLPGSRIISTDSDVYKFLNDGTRKNYPITPKNAPRLAFQWAGPGSYQAKTTPRVIASNPGGPSGPIVYSYGVIHPGIEAREFTTTIKEKWDRELPDILQRAIDSELA